MRMRTIAYRDARVKFREGNRLKTGGRGCAANGRAGVERNREKRESRGPAGSRALHCFARTRALSRLNAVKLSSYSHKGNSLSQPVKYKRVFPSGPTPPQRAGRSPAFPARLLFGLNRCFPSRRHAAIRSVPFRYASRERPRLRFSRRFLA